MSKCVRHTISGLLSECRRHTDGRVFGVCLDCGERFALPAQVAFVLEGVNIAPLDPPQTPAVETLVPNNGPAQHVIDGKPMSYDEAIREVCRLRGIPYEPDADRPLVIE